MAILTTNGLTASEQQNMFITVDEKKDIIPTKGYYVIARRPMLQQLETAVVEIVGVEPRPKGVQIKLEIVATVDYSNGVAPYNPLYKPKDIVFIYPYGYFGLEIKGISESVMLQPANEIQGQTIERLTQFVNSKIIPVSIKI